ncbi:hypothetical protein Q1695_013384 [Nippostrongylus brasiliensis]|nr:hypothetical protein Q1695_013384 [Nippostrongylus brasiliensis]
MSKRGFLNLNDDNFWGNEDSKGEMSSEHEESSEEKELNNTSNADDVETAEESDECIFNEKSEWDGWESVRADMMKRSDGTVEPGNPFRYNSPIGGFSRTNAAVYYHDDGNGKKSERQTRKTSDESVQPVRQRPSTFLESGQMETQAELLSRRDFSTLDALNAVYRDKCVMSSNSAKESSRTKVSEDDGDDREAWERERLSTSGSGSNVTEQSGDGPRVGWSGSEQADLNMIDEQYVEYYEYLCQGVQKLLDSGITLNADCESRGNSTSFQQPSVCRALKSKYYYQYNLGPEIYSRKVFVGGLPIDIEEDELVETFARFGSLVVDWPNKNETKSYYPPKGYVFLIFDHETSVRTLVQHCTIEDEKLFLFISSSMNTEKLVQIRPWRLADADYLVDVNVPINLRRVVFVGGVPRPIRAVELAHIMDRLYGSVACAGIDTDVEYKYPKGAGRVAFTNYNSYMRAITERYAQLSHGEVEKRVEMKPYVLDDQICEECIREPNGGRHAPFFCPHLECLQYYCESCWTSMHGSPSREHHKPLVKEA